MYDASMETYEAELLLRLKALYPDHVALLDQSGFQWTPDVAAFCKRVTGGWRVIYTPEMLAGMPLDKLKRVLGGE